VFIGALDKAEFTEGLRQTGVMTHQNTAVLAGVLRRIRRRQCGHVGHVKLMQANLLLYGRTGNGPASKRLASNVGALSAGSVMECGHGGTLAQQRTLVKLYDEPWRT